MLDNYDDAMDCTVYIDDEGQEQHTAQEGAETTYPAIVPPGEHRWKVQCVDDAGNVGESDERLISVIDTSGPDITMNNPDVVYRGDPVTLSLDITDISGVDAVEAEMRDPDGNIQSIPLEKEDDTYTSSIPTTEDSPTGTYTVEVYAVDTLNNSNSATDEVLVTYRYIIELELEPQTAEPGEIVQVSGTVLYDNGSSIPEDTILIEVPENETANKTNEAELEGDSFSCSFPAPSDGTYEIVALVTSQENGQEYTGTSLLTVSSQSHHGEGDGGHGQGGGGRARTSDSPEREITGCSAAWSCTAWTTCSNGKQKRTCVDLNKCSTEDVKKTEKRSCTEQQEEEEDKDDRTGEGNTISAFRNPLPEPEEHEIDTVKKDKRNARGIGKASGFINLVEANLSSLLLALLLMALLVGTLYRYGWGKGDNRKRPAAVDVLGGKGDRIGLEDYLEKRAAKRRL